MSAAALLCVLLLAPNGIGVPTGSQPTGRTAPPPAQILALALAADGTTALAGDSEGVVRRWNVAGEQPERLDDLGVLPGAIRALVTGPAGETYALDDAGHVAVVTSGVQILCRHPGGAQALALLPASGDRPAQLATAGDDGKLGLWSLSGAPDGMLTTHEGPIAGLALVGEEVWTAGWDATVRRTKLGRRTSTKAKKLPLGTRELTSLAASPDGRWVLIAAFDGDLTLIDAAARKPEPVVAPRRAYPELVREVCWSPDGTRAVAVASAEQTLLLVDPTAPQAAPVALAEAAPPSTARFLDADTLLVGHFDGRVTRVTLPARVGGAK